MGSNQCGFVLHIPDPGEAQLERVRGALSLVASTNAIREWTEAGASTPRLNDRERAVMEQGGIAVKWLRGSPGSLQLNASDFSSSEVLAKAILELLVQRHEVLWRSPGTYPGACDAAVSEEVRS